MSLPFRAHGNLCHADGLGDFHDVNDISREKVPGDSDAGFLLRDNNLVGSHFFKNAGVDGVLGFGADKGNPRLLTEDGGQDAGIQVSGDADDSHVHVGDAQGVHGLGIAHIRYHGPSDDISHLMYSAPARDSSLAMLSPNLPRPNIIND